MKAPIIATSIVVALLLAGAQTTTGQTDPPGCAPVKRVYAEKRWRKAKPARGFTLCPVRDQDGRRAAVRHFYEYRSYRQIATMKCLPGHEGWFVPNPGSCSTIECESHFRWDAYNPKSGASDVYQLLGHGEPWPVRGFSDRLLCHEIASERSRSEWSC